MTGPRPASLQLVHDAGGLAYRVVLLSGEPLRDCSMCGLAVSQDAAAEHARRHGVKIVTPRARP